ncbi:MAG: monovalent cation/H+ antiporter subunit D family protein [Opitutales bacterium]
MPTTEIYSSTIPFWALLVSLLAVPMILWSTKKPNLREFWTLVAAAIKFVLVLSLLPGALEGRVAEVVLFEVVAGIEFSLRADSMGVFFAIVASGLWILTSFYSIGYMRGNKEKKQTRYFASFALSLSATIGIAFSANLLTFIIFYELLTLATYPLVVHKENREAIRAGRQYLAFALLAGVFLIAGAAWIYQATGTLDFQAGGILETDTFGPGAFKVIFLMFLVGIGVKSGIMPLQAWLPNAMVAPTPVSALLHAVAVVKSGVFGMVRVVGYVFGPEVMEAHGLNITLALLAGATILLSSLIALQQTNLKRMLAYSTVGHLSYIILGLSLLSTEGFLGGVLHISTHATMKITLFFCAGAIYVHTHKQDIRDLDGIGKAMPWTLGAFTIGAMGLAGLPPINGFLSKWYLGVGSLEAGHVIALFVLLLSGLLNAAYLFPIVYRAFFKDSGNFKGVGEASPFMVVPLCITGALSVVFFFAPNLFFSLFELAADVAVSVMGEAHE